MILAITITSITHSYITDILNVVTVTMIFFAQAGQQRETGPPWEGSKPSLPGSALVSLWWMTGFCWVGIYSRLLYIYIYSISTWYCTSFLFTSSTGYGSSLWGVKFSARRRLVSCGISSTFTWKSWGDKDTVNSIYSYLWMVLIMWEKASCLLMVVKPGVDVKKKTMTLLV